MQKSRTKIIAAVFFVALILRVLAVLALRDIHAGPTRAFGADGIEFNELAQQVASGHGYTLQAGHPTSFRAPGFPFCLSVIYFFAGQHYPFFYALFCLLGALACVLTYLFAEELCGPGIAMISAAIAAFYINGIYFATVFASESIFLVCFGLSLWLFLRYLHTDSYWQLVVSAIALGWGILTRPFALLLIPVFLFVLLLKKWGLRQHGFLPATVFAILPFLVICPWTIRNYRIFHRLVLVANNGGSGIYQGNNDVVLHQPYYMGAWITTVDLPYRYLTDAQPDEVSHDREEAHLGVQWILSHKRWMPLLCFYKLVRLWLPDISSHNKTYVLLQLIFATPVIIVMLIGIVHCVRQRRYWTPEWILVHGTIAATILVTLIFFGSPRYRDANIPVLMIYAAFGVKQLLPSRLRTRLALPGRDKQTPPF